MRSDVYALGLVLYELFTGKRAFDGRTLAELIAPARGAARASPSTVVGDLDPAVERAILRCLEKDPRRPAALRAGGGGGAARRRSAGRGARRGRDALAGDGGRAGGRGEGMAPGEGAGLPGRGRGGAGGRADARPRRCRSRRPCPCRASRPPSRTGPATTCGARLHPGARGRGARAGASTWTTCSGRRRTTSRATALGRAAHQRPAAARLLVPLEPAADDLARRLGPRLHVPAAADGERDDPPADRHPGAAHPAPGRARRRWRSRARRPRRPTGRPLFAMAGLDFSRFRERALALGAGELRRPARGVGGAVHRARRYPIRVEAACYRGRPDLLRDRRARGRGRSGRSRSSSRARQMIGNPDRRSRSCWWSSWWPACSRAGTC